MAHRSSPEATQSGTRLVRMASAAARSGAVNLEAHPRKTLAKAHETKLQLCDLLEEIADNLPQPDRLQCMHAANILTRELPIHHADEDLGLFPILKERCQPEDRFDAIAARLSDEHVDIEASMAEVIAALNGYADGAPPASGGNAVGYALRGMFEGLRRHIAWEEATVTPLAKDRLTPEDWRELHGIMIELRVGARPNALMRV